MSSGEILFSFLTIRERCPGENLWSQGQLSQGFQGIWEYEHPHENIIFNRVIFYLFSEGFFYCFPRLQRTGQLDDFSQTLAGPWMTFHHPQSPNWTWENAAGVRFSVLTEVL